MKPRHFWWLVETLQMRGAATMTDDVKDELMTLIDRAERGEI